jgi:hypothetical protein
LPLAALTNSLLMNKRVSSLEMSTRVMVAGIRQSRRSKKLSKADFCDKEKKKGNKDLGSSLTRTVVVGVSRRVQASPLHNTIVVVLIRVREPAVPSVFYHHDNPKHG